MARKKKEEKSFKDEEKKEKKKIEKKVVKKQEEKQPQLYSILELSNIFGVSRGMDLKEKISIEDAKKLL